MEQNQLTAGQIARLLSVTKDTLRHYQRKGLLTPAYRTEAGYRMYDNDNVRRIKFIKQAQSFGLTLSNIKELITIAESDNPDYSAILSLLSEKKIGMELKITALSSTLPDLTKLITELQNSGNIDKNSPLMAALERCLTEEPEEENG